MIIAIIVVIIIITLLLLIILINNNVNNNASVIKESSHLMSLGFDSKMKGQRKIKLFDRCLYFEKVV